MVSCAPPSDTSAGEVDTDVTAELPDVLGTDLSGDEPDAKDSVAPGDVGPRCAGPVEVALETGVVSLTANLEVLPVWLHLYLDLAVDPSTSELTGLGTYARLQTRAPGLPANYDHPEGLEVALDEGGWAFHFRGCANAGGGGGLAFTSEPFDLEILLLDAVPVVLDDVIIQAAITSRPDERERLTGTFTTSGGSFGDPPTAVEPIDATWTGYGLLPSEIVAPLPCVCEASPCAELEAVGGTCTLPTPYEPGPPCAD